MSATPAEQIMFRALDGDDDGDLLDRFHREVLMTSFSADELDHLDVMARGLRGEGEAQTLASVALGPGDALLGGVVGELYRSEHVLLLAYLAVRPELRGRGIGTALLEHVATQWYANPGVSLAVGEVHDPRRWSETGGEDAVSRLRFYERLGARVLDVPFVQPALDSRRARIEGFLLLAMYAGPEAVVSTGDGESVRADLVGRFVRHYYEVAEGVREPRDPQLVRLLGAIEGRPAIRLLPLAEYERIPLLS